MRVREADGGGKLVAAEGNFGFWRLRLLAATLGGIWKPRESAGGRGAAPGGKTAAGRGRRRRWSTVLAALRARPAANTPRSGLPMETAAERNKRVPSRNLTTFTQRPSKRAMPAQ